MSNYIDHNNQHIIKLYDYYLYSTEFNIGIRYLDADNMIYTRTRYVYTVHRAIEVPIKNYL